MRHVGIRELRSDLAAVVRRAAAGEVTAVTISGRPVAMMAPLAQAGERRADLSALVASGAVIAPRRVDRRLDDEPIRVWGNVRLDRMLREIRG